MAKDVADEIQATGPYREDLVVFLYVEFESEEQVFFDVGPELMERWFILGEGDNVIGISEIIRDAFHFFQPMIETRQIIIGEILA